MAASSSKVGGYVCEFIDEVSVDFFVCKSCKHVAREPHTTSCCGETFCQVCIENKKPCPSCGEEEFTVTLQAKYKQKILSYRVCCAMKDRGCEWTGKLEGLDAHLNIDTGDCQYVDVPCPDCDQQVQKRELATHLGDACPQRDYNCRYCGFSGTYEVVCNDHWPECEQYPIPCPNYCGLGAIERCTLEDHLPLCPMQEVECDFVHAGCTEKFLRQDLERHMEENTQKHLVLMSAATLRISREFERKLQEQSNSLQENMKTQEAKHEEMQHQQQMLQEQSQEHTREQLQERDQKIEQLQQNIQEAEAKTTQLQQQVEERDKQIQIQFEQQREEFQESLRRKEQEIGELKQQLQEKDKEFDRQLQEKDQQIQEAETKIGGLQHQVEEKQHHIDQINSQIEKVTPYFTILPFSFTMPNFDQQLKRSVWFSPRMYTHLCGYKLSIGVAANGLVSSTGTHVAVLLSTVPGEFDDQLPWPGKCTITLKLLNQHRDQDHVTVTKELELNRAGEKPRSGSTSHGYGGYSGVVQYSGSYGGLYGVHGGYGRYGEYGGQTGGYSGPVPYGGQSGGYGGQTGGYGTGGKKYVLFSRTFIAHKDLGWNADKQTQYLKDDCLKFRVELNK